MAASNKQDVDKQRWARIFSLLTYPLTRPACRCALMGNQPPWARCAGRRPALTPPPTPSPLPPRRERGGGGGAAAGGGVRAAKVNQWPRAQEE